VERRLRHSEKCSPVLEIRTYFENDTRAQKHSASQKPLAFLTMATPTPSSGPHSGISTPNPRFTAQASSAEDLLKSQTVGLVHLSDFRKRRAEALEQRDREATDRSLGRFTPTSRSGAVTPSDG
jgi:hypothetical protein